MSDLGCCGAGLSSTMCVPLCSENSKMLCVYVTSEAGLTEVFGVKGCVDTSQFCKCLCVQQKCSVGGGLCFCTNQSDCRITEVSGGEHGIFKNESKCKELCVSSAMTCKVGDFCGEYSMCLMSRKCLCCYMAGNFLPKTCFVEILGTRCIGRSKSTPPQGEIPSMCTIAPSTLITLCSMQLLLVARPSEAS